RPDSGGASETARSRDVDGGRTRICKAPALGALKEKIGGLGRDRREIFLFCRSRDRHRIVNSKRHPETIKPRAKIGSAGGNADGDAFHEDLWFSFLSCRAKLRHL